MLKLKKFHCCCWLVSVLLLICGIMGFEENPKFCIHTGERMLKQENVSDINQSLDNEKIHTTCDIVVQTLNLKEKENFFNTICNQEPLKELYYYFKYRNGNLSGRGSHHDLCANKNKNPLLAWLSYQQLQNYYSDELDPKENTNYIAKAKDNESDKTELCYFRHSDLVNNISENLFTCVVMIHEDNFYDLNDNINALIEIQPSLYEIRNITYTPWINTTASYKSLLGKTLLKNRNFERKNIFGSLSYAYVEKVILNLTDLYDINKDLDTLPVLFEHKNVVIKLNEQGEGGIDVNDKIFFGRKLEGKTQISVNVIGQWFEHYQQFNADIYEYYGYGIRRFRQELHNGHVTFTRIDSAEPVYELPEPHVDAVKNKQFARIRVKDDAIDKQNDTYLHTTFTNQEDLDNETDPTNIDNYYPWFVLAFLLAGIFILTIVIVMTYFCNENGKQQKRYKFIGLKKANYPVNE